VETDLPLHNCRAPETVCGKDGSSSLKFELNTLAPGFGLLAPSIGDIEVDERNQRLALFGSFGGTFGSPSGQYPGTLTVGGQTAEIVGWTSDGSLITANFPTPGVGPGSAGDVIVTVRGHQSNIARITEWQGNFTYKRIPVETPMCPAGDRVDCVVQSALSETITFSTAFRGDIREWRPVIHYPPLTKFSGGMTYQMIPGSNAMFSCTGTAQYIHFVPLDSVTIQNMWTGSGNLKPSFEVLPVLEPTSFELVGILDSTKLQAHLYVDGTNTCSATITDSTGFSSTTQFFAIPDPASFDLNFDPGTAVIQPGAIPQLCDGGVQPAPFEKGCIATFQWNRIVPLANTEPDPNSAR
jgi:hypothetical protein